ncbi:MAG: NAD-dependent epimerase/dehydratase family protein [Lachnospiraceae bacterium]|jgi:nucleoside-diphosphate-sugar epimerase|nr:NAD-dependent epimerase/dehydratase family protein [Lachnospiraceae bacterium]
MKKKALILGGTGGLSGRLAALARDEYDVWALTRGSKPPGDGIHPLVADRGDEAAFADAVCGAGRFDAVFDCICMNEDHARQDLRVLPEVTDRLVVVSTDSVYDPDRKFTPQCESPAFFVEEAGSPETLGYAANKRRMEAVFEGYFADAGNMAVTIFRPGHIYGPGFLAGCYPEHSRQKDLPDRILRRDALRLVAAGVYLIHPVFVDDLALAMLDCVHKEKAFNRIFGIGGPEAVENRIYYELMGKILGVPVTVEEVPLTGYADAHPEYAGHLNHRIYDLGELKAAGVRMPDTPLEAGLRKHLSWLGYGPAPVAE